MADYLVKDCTRIKFFVDRTAMDNMKEKDVCLRCKRWIDPYDPHFLTSKFCGNSGLFTKLKSFPKIESEFPFLRIRAQG